MLDQERAYYKDHLPELLSKYAGRIVLIKGDELIDVFNTAEEALSEGLRLYGVEPYLIRTVQEFEQPVHIPALTLGILRGDSTRSI